MVCEFTGERVYQKEVYWNTECWFREVRCGIFDKEGYGLRAY